MEKFLIGFGVYLLISMIAFFIATRFAKESHSYYKLVLSPDLEKYKELLKVLISIREKNKGCETAEENLVIDSMYLIWSHLTMTDREHLSMIPLSELITPR